MERVESFDRGDTSLALRDLLMAEYETRDWFEMRWNTRQASSDTARDSEDLACR